MVITALAIYRKTYHNIKRNPKRTEKRLTMGKKKVAKKASGAGRAGYPEVDERGCDEVCPMCSEVIVEASEDTEGQDAIFCD